MDVAVLMGLLTVTVDLPEMFSLQNLRWRMASDTTGSKEGWRVDNVIVLDATTFRRPVRGRFQLRALVQRRCLARSITLGVKFSSRWCQLHP